MNLRKLQWIGVLCVASVLSACATPAAVQATGGSRADGTVRLSYEYKDWPLTVPKVDAEQALTTAIARCKGWGYSGAEPFGGHSSLCTKQGLISGCGTWTVTLTYQCTGNLPSSQ